jgi:glutathione S-transferase
VTSDIPQPIQQLAGRIGGLSCQSVAKPVLVYFDIIGICWPIRCLLHLKGVDYELIKIPFLEAWLYTTPDGKRPVADQFRNNHLPLYVDSDVYLTQSTVILTYLGEKYDLVGDSPAEKLAVMDVIAHAYDALFHWAGMLQVNLKINTPDDVVESRLQAFLGNGAWGIVTDGYRRHLDGFERYLDANPNGSNGYMVGSRLTVADLHAFSVLCNWYKAFDRARFVAQYPRLDAYIRRIASTPLVDDYRRHRQERTTWFPLPQLALRLTTPEELEGLTGESAGG